MQQQALMLSYPDDFFFILILAVIFLSLAPFVLLMHKSEPSGPPTGDH